MNHTTLKLGMTRKVILSLMLFFGSLHAMDAAEEEVVVQTAKQKHQQLQKDFKLGQFLVLTPDPQGIILDYLKPDPLNFEKDLQLSQKDRYLKDSQGFTVDWLKGALVAEFFYNHAQKYNQQLQAKKGNTNFVVVQQPSQLCRINNCDNVMNSAAKSNDLELLSLAITMKADVNQNGIDILRHTLIYGYYECTLKLIDAGAHVKDEHVLMVSQWSFYHLKHPESIRNLQAAGQYDQAVAKKIHARDVAEKLIETGADVHALNDCNRTSLYYAVREGNESLVQLLLSHGARANITTSTGYPLLNSSDIENPVIKDLVQQAQVQQRAADRRERLGGCCSVS